MEVAVQYPHEIVSTVELPQVQVQLSLTTFCMAYAAGAVIQPPNLGSTYAGPWA